MVFLRLCREIPQGVPARVQAARCGQRAHQEVAGELVDAGRWRRRRMHAAHTAAARHTQRLTVRALGICALRVVARACPAARRRAPAAAASAPKKQPPVAGAQGHFAVRALSLRVIIHWSLISWSAWSIIMFFLTCDHLLIIDQLISLTDHNVFLMGFITLNVRSIPNHTPLEYPRFFIFIF